MTCADCLTPLERIDAFPGRLCLDCYAESQRNKPLPTAAEIVNMWGGRA